MVRLEKEPGDVPVKEEFEEEMVKEKEPETAVDRLVLDARERLKEWIPRTSLGKAVVAGEIRDVKDIFSRGMVIREPEIVDFLLPNLENELVLTGGVPGKGGGKMRTGIRVTSRMHKSGRKRALAALVLIGNRDGVFGLGYTGGKDARTAISKATQQAKLNLIQIRRGCGSWECMCKQSHSIPFKVEGKSGSVRIKLMPAPRGLGIAASEHIRKVLQLAGIKDIWMKSFGETGSRINFTKAVFNAFENLNKMKIDAQVIETLGLKEGVVETAGMMPAPERREPPRRRRGRRGA